MEDTHTAPSEKNIAAGQYVHHLDHPVSDAQEVEPQTVTNLIGAISDLAASPEQPLTPSPHSSQEALRLFKIRAYWYKKHLRCSKKKVRYNCR